MRIILDIAGQECDVGAIELDKDDNASKILDDEGKLPREGKGILDHLVKLHLTDDEDKLIFFIVQLSGCQGELSTVHLVSNGLYLAVPQQPWTSPRTFAELDKFLDMLKVLYIIRQEMERLADMIPTGYSRNRKFSCILVAKEGP